MVLQAADAAAASSVHQYITCRKVVILTTVLEAIYSSARSRLSC